MGKPGVDEIEDIVRLALNGANLRNEESGVRDDKPARLRFKLDFMPKRRFQFRDGAMPYFRIARNVEIFLARLIRRGNPAPAADRLDLRPDREREPPHRIAYLRKVRKVAPRTDMHVQPGNRHAVSRRLGDRFAELLVPDPVLRKRTARIRLIAVPVTEAGIDADRQLKSLGAFAQPFRELVDHIERADVHDAAERVAADELERVGVENIARIRDLFGLISDGERAHDFSGAHRVDL